MKKLLSILTISTLTASTPAPLLANAPLDRFKNDIGVYNSKNDYLPINKINGISEEISAIAVDSKNTIYFGTDDGAYKLLAGLDRATKINGINGVRENIVDNDNTIYFGTDKGVFVLKQGSTTPTKIDGISKYIYSFAIDSKNNIYYASSDGIYKLVAGSDTPTKIEGITEYINKVLVDSKDNIYYATAAGVFVLKQGSTTATKINNLSGSITSLAVDSKDNIYFLDNYVFVLKQGSTTPTKINNINKSKSIFIDKVNNVYIGTNKGAYKLIAGSITPEIINDINGFISSIIVDNNKNIYFNLFEKGIFKLQSALSWLKSNVNFNLVDKSKNMVWLRNDQLVANGQVKVKIVNTDIENVKVDSTVMPSPDKKWDFNLPENSTVSENRDYNIEISFKVDGKSYTGQIIVSSLLAQPSITVQKNTSSFENINSYVYQVPTNDKVGDVTLTSDLYYSDTEVKVSLNKPTGSTVQSGVIYGLNENWQKTGEQLSITSDLSLNATMLNAFQGRFLVETKDSANNSSVYYIVLNKDNLTPNFWNTNQGEQFYQWTNFNGYNENIKKLNATELNIIIKASENWQKIATDSQFATAVAEWFKNNAKLLSKDPLTAEQVIEQLKKQIPSSIKIPAINTNNYDPTKVSFELDKSEFKPNDKVNITVKYYNEKSSQFTLQIKDSKAPDNSVGDSKLWIIGVVVGVLAFVGIAYLLFKRFIFDKYFLPKIKKNRHDKLVAQVRKEEAEKDKENNGGHE